MVPFDGNIEMKNRLYAGKSGVSDVTSDLFLNLKTNRW